MSDIVARLEASIKFDAINGDTFERNVVRSQIVEAIDVIKRLRAGGKDD